MIQASYTKLIKLSEWQANPGWIGYHRIILTAAI